MIMTYEWQTAICVLLFIYLLSCADDQIINVRLIKMFDADVANAFNSVYHSDLVELGLIIVLTKCNHFL